MYNVCLKTNFLNTYVTGHTCSSFEEAKLFVAVVMTLCKKKIQSMVPDETFEEEEDENSCNIKTGSGFEFGCVIEKVGA